MLTERSSAFWLTTDRRWLTKQDQSMPAERGSVTSRNMDRCMGGCDWPGSQQGAEKILSTLITRWVALCSVSRMTGVTKMSFMQQISGRETFSVPNLDQCLRAGTGLRSPVESWGLQLLFRVRKPYQFGRSLVWGPMSAWGHQREGVRWFHVHSETQQSCNK